VEVEAEVKAEVVGEDEDPHSRRAQRTPPAC